MTEYRFSARDPENGRLVGFPVQTNAWDVVERRRDTALRVCPTAIVTIEQREDGGEWRPATLERD